MVVLVTGGTRGVGYALCQRFKKKGHIVIVNYDSSDEIAFTMQKEGFDIYKQDVSNSFGVQKMFKDLFEKYGKIDLLINNAGISLYQKLLIDTTEQEFDKIFNVNVKGVYNTTKEYVNRMLNKVGKIINVSSIFALKGGSCEVIYTASKCAVSGFTKAVSQELCFSKIGVCQVVLGLIDTQMNEHLSSKDKLDFVKECKLCKIYTPNDVAKRIYNLAQKNYNVINGKTYKIGVGKI